MLFLFLLLGATFFAAGLLGMVWRTVEYVLNGVCTGVRIFAQGAWWTFWFLFGVLQGACMIIAQVGLWLAQRAHAALVAYRGSVRSLVARLMR